MKLEITPKQKYIYTDLFRISDKSINDKNAPNNYQGKFLISR